MAGEQKDLSPREVNERIQSKFCKVITPYGEGTGYFIKDEDGILISSFHLVGSIEHPAFPIQNVNDMKAALLLCNKGYLNSFFRLSAKVTPEMAQNINLVIPQLWQTSYITPTGEEKPITISPEESVALNSHPEILAKIKSLLATFNQKEALLHTRQIEIQYAGKRLFAVIADPPDMERSKWPQIEKNYAFFDAAPFRITAFEDGTPFQKRGFLNTGEDISPLPIDEPPQIGEPIYFGGFPLGSTEYTFSVGMVSGVITEETRTQIVIEAPISPGHSGSPIFIQRNGRIFHVGTITSEVATVSDKLLELRGQLKDPRNEVMKAGGFHLAGTLSEVIETMLGNLTTGKGKAIQLHGLKTLFTLPAEPHALDRFLDFSVVKPKPKQEKLKLFEFINQNCKGSVSAEDLHKYLTEHVDTETRQNILKQINYQPNLKASIRIKGTLEKDLEPNELQIYGKHEDREPLKSLYKYVLLASTGRLANNQVNFTDEDLPVHDKHRVTLKFFKDHVSGSDRKSQATAASAVAKKRFTGTVSVSTTLAETSLDDLTKEVISSEGFYRDANACAKAAAEKHGFVEGLFFQTAEEHRLQICEKNGGEKSSKSSFFYSVAEKGQQFFMHHFAATTPQETWQPLRVPGYDKRNSYFTLKK